VSEYKSHILSNKEIDNTQTARIKTH